MNKFFAIWWLFGLFIISIDCIISWGGTYFDILTLAFMSWFFVSWVFNEIRTNKQTPR